MALQFVIIQQDSLIAVDNTAISPLDLTGLAANIGQISFQKDAGKVQYNDRPPNPVEFTDPSPYQIYINRWITAAAALVLPLQLAQAKQVKSDLVEAIYHHKRRLPYLGQDASDEALLAYVGGSVGGVGGLVDLINARIVAVNNSSAATVNGWSANHDHNWAGLFVNNSSGQAYSVNGIIGGAPNPGSVGSGPGYGGFQNMSNVGSGGVGLGSTANGIIARRNLLYTDKTNKQTAINALATIAAVIAYDATTGWSS